MKFNYYYKKYNNNANYGHKINIYNCGLNYIYKQLNI